MQRYIARVKDIILRLKNMMVFWEAEHTAIMAQMDDINGALEGMLETDFCVEFGEACKLLE